MSGAVEWALKYRPKKFSEICGQGAAVAELSGFIRKGAPRSVFLKGPTGVGKTTLARAYAGAIFCMANLADGSPCGACRNCAAFEKDHLQDFIVLARHEQSIARLREVIETTRYATFSGLPRVVLLDERGGSEEVYGALLSELEAQNRASTHYILTGTDARNVPSALLARLAVVHLDKVEPALVAHRLATIAAEEGVDAQEGALDLIASAGESVRLAVRDLQDLHGRGPVSVAAVEAGILAPRFGWITAYLEAIAHGEIGAADTALGRALGEPADIADRIQATLVAIKQRFAMLKQGRSVRPYVLSDDQLLRLFDAFRPAAQSQGASTADYWTALVDFWLTRGAITTMTGLKSASTLMVDLAHQAPALQPLAKPLFTPTQLLARPKVMKTPSSCADPGRYLSADHARQILDGASFLPQVHGVGFNVRIELMWPKALPDDECAQRASDALHHLQKLLARRGLKDVGGFHRMLVQDRVDGRLRSTVICHVPVRHHDWLRRWLASPKREQRLGCELTADLPKGALHRRAEIDRHWSLVRAILRGLDPTLCIGPAGALADIVGVPVALRRAAGEIACRRLVLSSTLGVSAMAGEGRDYAPAFMAFASGQWGFLVGDWPWEEHERRKTQKAAWAAKKAALEGGSHPLGAEAMAAHITKELLNQQYNWIRYAPPWGPGDAASPQEGPQMSETLAANIREGYLETADAVAAAQPGD